MDVSDAAGTSWFFQMGGGTGGSTFTMFESERPIAYPVTIRVRIPEDVTIRTLSFDLDGLAVPPARAP